ncbi:hypothetical protein KIN20_038242 [Parelaphostrongylus tenuis]|uniref:Riboflavin transporter n=1 Tax=Parelaphostrongylus tenuis TaxID=148309 RepID=A0AAD5WME5_PARTN|nr:hypothetical protein KIN20_038242 [Parelaphostrongylus tenuis]
MRRFHHAYLNAYFVGMGFSSFIPGSGKDECEHVAPILSGARFSVSTFFFIIFIWTVVGTVSFEVLCRFDRQEIEHSQYLDRGDGETLLNNPQLTNFGSVLDVTESREKVTTLEHREASSTISRTDYIVILISTALINAQMYGIMPSTQSYATLPYSSATYHYGVTLANLVSPVASVLPLIITVRSVPTLCCLALCLSCATAFTVYLASLSPNLIFDSVTIGSILSVGSGLIAAGLYSYIRVVFALLLREGEQSESRLFWWDLLQDLL